MSCRKVKMCSHVVAKGNCPLKSCTFAHSFCELEPRVCGYTNCNRRDVCPFRHSDESMEEYIFRNNLISGVDWGSIKASKVATQVCKNVGKCTFKHCTFAHSLKEFSPIVCRSDSRCYNIKTCKFLHPSVETKVQYVERLGIEIPMDDEDTCSEVSSEDSFIPQDPYMETPVIVNFDDEDDE